MGLAAPYKGPVLWVGWAAKVRVSLGHRSACGSFCRIRSVSAIRQRLANKPGERKGKGKCECDRHSFTEIPSDISDLSTQKMSDTPFFTSVASAPRGQNAKATLSEHIR